MSAGDISIRFAAEGDQTLKTAISAIDAELKALNAGVKSSTEAMKGMGDTEEETAKRNELLARSIEANKEKIALLTRQYDDAKAKLAQLAQAMEEAQRSGNREEIERTANAYNRQSVEVSRLESAMSRAQGEINRATNEMQSGGEKTDSFKEKISGLADSINIKLAKDALQGVVDGLASFGKACIDVGKKVWDLASESSVFADDLITLATKTGISVGKLQEYAYAARFVDTEVSTITGSIVKLTRNMASTSESTSEAFKRLGISVTDSKGNMKDAESVFWEAIDALGKVRNETERDQIAMTLFGKSAQDLNPLIIAGSKAWEAYAQEARDAGLIISDEGVNALGGFNDALQRIEATMAAAKNQLVAALAPAFTSVADAVSKAAQKFTVWAQSIEGQEQLQRIAELVTALADKLLVNLSPAVDAIISTFGNIDGVISGLSANISQIVGAIQAAIAIFITLKTALAALQIAALVTNPVGAAIVAITALVATVYLLITRWEDVKRGAVACWNDIKNAWANAGNWFKSIAQTIINGFTGIGDKIAGFFRGAWESVKTAWNGVGTFFANIVSTISTKFGPIGQIIGAYFQSAWNAVKAAWSAATGYFKAVWDSIKGIFSAVESVFKGDFSGAWNAIKGIVGTWVSYFQNIWNSIKNVFSPLANTFRTIFQNAWTNIQNAFNNVKSFFTNKANDIKNAFTNIPGAMLNVGREIVEGLWNGINNMVGWITGKVKGFTDSVVGSFKSFFGIKSPSTVMRDQVGRYLAEGIGEGILGEKSYIQRAVDAVMPDVSGIGNNITLPSYNAEPMAQQPIYLQVDGTTFARLMTGYIDRRQGENMNTALALGIS